MPACTRRGHGEPGTLSAVSETAKVTAASAYKVEPHELLVSLRQYHIGASSMRLASRLWPTGVRSLESRKCVTTRAGFWSMTRLQ